MQNSMENMHADIRLQWVKPWDVVWIFKMNATYAAHSKDKSCDWQFFMFICKSEMKASIPYYYWQTLFLMNGYQFQDCAASLKLAMIY